MRYWTCRHMQRMMAQGAYELLADGDRRALEAHLGACPACRETSASFQRIAATSRDRVPGLDFDLLGRVRARLREEEERAAPRRGWRVAGAGALMAVVLSIGVAAWRAEPERPGIVAALGPVDRGVNAAEVLAADRNYSGAYTQLAETIEAYPGHPDIAGAIQLASDIAFDELELYEEAYLGYESLQQHHRAVFNAEANRGRNQFRWNLLAECRASYANYEPLHALNRAEGNFGELERIVGRQPLAYVASLAADEMARIAMEQGGIDNRVAAMEEALWRCTDPVAIARLKIEVGDLLRGEADGQERARGIYREVAEGRHEALARRALESIDELDAIPRP